jgi:hypothetical protein
MTAFTIGCDPEVFVTDLEGKPVTAHGLVPGDKKNPFKVDRGAVQVDGMALEFNIDPVPYNDFNAFDTNVITVLNRMKKMIPGHKLLLEPSVQFDKDYYDNHVPEDAKELGCDPDYCAYSKDPFEPNPRPDGDSGLRSAAGHIHIGWGSDIPVDNPEHMEICRSFIRNLDAYVGLGMTIIDGDERRRSLYGKAGAFRPKSYGVEYRTPSNKWLVSKAARQFIHMLVHSAISDMQHSGANCFFARLQGRGYNVQEIINTGDQKMARTLLQNYAYINSPEALVKLGEKKAG